MSELNRVQAGGAEAVRTNADRTEAGAGAVVVDTVGVDAVGAGGEIEVRRSVWRLLARELSEPSEELLAFVAARLEVRAPAGATGELTRRAIQEFAGARWAVGERLGPRTSGRGRKRAGEHGSLPGYYLG